MSLKFGRIQPWTAELAALDQFKKSFIREYSKYFDDLLSGERSLPFGLLVFYFCLIRFICMNVAMCGPVHDVETIHRLC